MDMDDHEGQHGVAGDVDVDDGQESNNNNNNTVTGHAVDQQWKSDLQSALDRVSVWKARANERLPHSVDTSHALALCLWNDYCTHNNNNSSTSTTPQSSFHTPTVHPSLLQHAYASAIIRGVNGLADVLQQKRYVAMSIAKLCAHIGLPSWLVDVRHDATHNQLAKLPLLRLAAQTFLDFLQERYWAAVAAQHCQQRESAMDMLVLYENAMDEAMELAKVMKQDNEKESGNVVEVNGNEGVNDSKVDDWSETDTPNGNGHDQVHDEEQTRHAGRKRQAVGDSDGGDNDGDENDDDDDEEDEAWQKDEADILWGKALGTNRNMYAIFAEPSPRTTSSSSSSRSSKHKERSTKAEKTPKKRKRRKKRTASHKTRQSQLAISQAPRQIALNFVRRTPINVGHESALRFLVWGGDGGPASESAGRMISVRDTDIAATKEGFHQCKARCSTLLEIMLNHWPGFQSALLIHLVDFGLVVQDGPAAKDGNDKLFFVLEWIRYFLSSNVRSTAAVNNNNTGVSKEATNESTGNDSLASYAELRQAGLPLNSLCDRLEDIIDSDGGSLPLAVGRFVKDLIELFITVLGNERCRNHGVDFSSNESPSTSIPNNTKDDKSQTDKSKNNDKNTKPVRKKPRWIKCKTWDRCAIGSLPGTTG